MAVAAAAPGIFASRYNVYRQWGVSFSDHDLFKISDVKRDYKVTLCGSDRRALPN